MPAPVMALAPMLAAALAVNEAFLYVSGHVGVAGRRAVGLSLWDPAPGCDWLGATVTEPVLSLLPARLWLIGLGHLGQAYLWGLGLLPFARPQDLSLVLQDIDIITPSTESTSILSDSTLINIKKTRAMAAWAERRAFRPRSTSASSTLRSGARTMSPPSPCAGSTTAWDARRSIKSASTSW